MDGCLEVPCVMVLEDGALIALDIEDMLAGAGFDVGPVFSSCATALGWLETNTPDVVVLDVKLRDGDCVRVAQTLFARNIPFVVHSVTLPRIDPHDEIFLKGRWVTKPASPNAWSKRLRRPS